VENKVTRHKCGVRNIWGQDRVNYEDKVCVRWERGPISVGGVGWDRTG